MKKNIVTVLIIAAIAALLWFFQSRNQIAPAPSSKTLQGEWQLDSIALEKQGVDSLSLLITAMLGGEQSIRFISDSSLLWLSEKDSSERKYHLLNNSLILEPHGDTNIFHIREHTDSSMQWLHSKDSTVFYWKKKH